MKPKISKTVILLLTIAVITACNNSNGTSGKRPDKIRHDTSQVLAMYVSAEAKKTVKWGMIPRVIIDSIMWVDTDTVTQVKQWTIDTSYIVGYTTLIDSNLARQYKLPMFDSAGKLNSITLTYRVEKRFVRSGWNGVDSVLIKEMLNQQ